MTRLCFILIFVLFLLSFRATTSLFAFVDFFQRTRWRFLFFNVALFSGSQPVEKVIYFVLVWLNKFVIVELQVEIYVKKVNITWKNVYCRSYWLLTIHLSQYDTMDLYTKLLCNNCLKSLITKILCTNFNQHIFLYKKT